MPAQPTDDDHAVLQQFGKNVREARHARGMTQVRLAAAANVHRSSIARIEAGSMNPNLTAAIRIAGVLDVGLDELSAG